MSSADNFLMRSSIVFGTLRFPLRKLSQKRGQPFSKVMTGIICRQSAMDIHKCERIRSGREFGVHCETSPPGRPRRLILPEIDVSRL